MDDADGQKIRIGLDSNWRVSLVHRRLNLIFLSRIIFDPEDSTAVKFFAEKTQHSQLVRLMLSNRGSSSNDL